MSAIAQQVFLTGSIIGLNARRIEATTNGSVRKRLIDAHLGNEG